MDFYITLDYELYNGLKSGTVKNCLITPTEELIRVLNRYGMKAVFFVDTCFLNRLFELKSTSLELEKDWALICKQLKYLSDNGHDIELHIHPNWRKATYENGNWRSIMDDYKLSDLPPDEADALFRDGISLLQQILGKKVTAFRAGAYCIQTYKNYVNVFQRYGIKIDSSVNRNKYAKTEKWEWYDFRFIPPCYYYKFETDICQQSTQGAFEEFSIPNYRVTKINMMRKRKAMKRSPVSNKPWGDGTPSVGGNLYKGIRRTIIRLCKKFQTSYLPASIDGDKAFFLEAFYTSQSKNSDYFMIMGHPKCLSPYSLFELEAFLQRHSKQLSNRLFLSR